MKNNITFNDILAWCILFGIAAVVGMLIIYFCVNNWGLILFFIVFSPLILMLGEADGKSILSIFDFSGLGIGDIILRIAGIAEGLLLVVSIVYAFIYLFTY